MSGHSKFANIKHKKEKNDAAKGKIFTIIAVSYTHLDVYKRQAHDRYFLDRIVTKVVEISRHTATVFPGKDVYKRQ